MRIAVMTGQFPKVSETFVLHHVNGLLQRGHDVSVFAEHRSTGADFARDDPLANALLSHTTFVEVPSLRTGRRVLTAPYRIAYCAARVPRLTLGALNPLDFGRDALNLSQVNRLFGLVRIPRPLQYDVVHAHFGMVGARFRFVTRLWRAPLVVSFHGFDLTLWPRDRGRACYVHLFEEAAALVANSEYTRNLLMDLGCPPHKIEKIYPAWDMASFPFTDHQRASREPMRVLTVARLVEKKGIDDAIAAVALVRKSWPDIRFDIVGEGPLRPHLESLIAALNLRGIVTLRGAGSRDYVRHMMEKAHIFLLPSVTSPDGDVEGLGVVLLEAQAAGLPVVATTHGPFPEVVVHGETGFLAPEHAPEELACWIATLLEHPDTARAMGRAAREHVEQQFAPEQINTHCVNLYERVIAEFSPGSPEKPG